MHFAKAFFVSSLVTLAAAATQKTAAGNCIPGANGLFCENVNNPSVEEACPKDANGSFTAADTKANEGACTGKQEDDDCTVTFTCP
ncbi:hypothetical protein CSUB01_11582 [Colletotrichum sublineola]|uniref:Uncharacterized protein n=1 Tax=Colletotrichum sublineola TaxID=1173701 RepID=A0A066XWJ4_COLSU|nr:hypothetical protein CSUB01_11582 [Colletotrichum sublineola]